MKKIVKNWWMPFLTLSYVFIVLGGLSNVARAVIISDLPVEPDEIPNTTYFSSESLQALSFPAPDNPSGMDFTNNQILMVSEQAGRLYVVSPDDGSLIRTVRLPGFSDRDPGGFGIAATDSFWWHSDYQRRKLYRLDPSDGSILEELPMPSRYLGIATVGNSLWGVSPNAEKLFRIDTSTGSILETISLSFIDGPIDLTWDGTYLWVSERDDVGFYQIEADGTILRTESAPQNPWGIAAQNPYMWVGTRWNSVLYRLDVGPPIGSIHVGVDIKPGSCPNPLNVKSKGVLPVAILGSEDFDVNSIDVASIRLAGVGPIRSSFEDAGTPLVDANECECSTEGPDGFGDLILKFETQEIVEAIGEVDHGDELVLELTGVLSDETPIEGSDCILIRGKHKPLNRADFNSDGIVDMADFAAFTDNWLQ